MEVNRSRGLDILVLIIKYNSDIIVKMKIVEKLQKL